MPCYQVNLMSVEFLAENLDLLEKAVRAEGGTFQRYGDSVEIRLHGRSLTYDIKGQKMITEQYGNVSSEINALKRAYSREVVQKAAKKNHWSLRSNGVNQYIATKY